MEMTSETYQEQAPVEDLTWEKPAFKLVSISLECTAYAGAL